MDQLTEPGAQEREQGFCNEGFRMRPHPSVLRALNVPSDVIGHIRALCK